ncbi:MAG: hypothetical protein ACI88A_003577 [Paraglaciecola sp.]|jgi:hypothetical protein
MFSDYFESLESEVAIKLIHVEEHFPYFPFIFFIAYCSLIVCILSC